MKRTDAFLTINPPWRGATFPTAHPRPNDGPMPFRAWESKRNRPSAAAPSEAPYDTVAIDSTVEIRDLDTDESEVYTLVHPERANILRNCISSFTPIGRALIGRRAGEVVEVAAPRGAVRIRIEKIRRPSKAKDSSRLASAARIERRNP
jgi:hypothetical protein